LPVMSARSCPKRHCRFVAENFRSRDLQAARRLTAL
jgi:hypothetical protein